MSRQALTFTIIVLVILGIGVFYLYELERRYAPPSTTAAATSDQSARTKLSEAALQQGGTEKQIVTLYFPSYAEGKLVPETRELALAPENAKRIRQVLLALVEGSHQGRNSALPSSTTVRAVFLMQDGTAIIDLSQGALADFTPGIESEMLSIYSMVDSLAANIPAVKNVKFLVQGREVQTLDGHIDLTGYFAPEPSLIAAQSP